MSLTTEMSALAGGILASRETRKRALHGIHTDTKQVLTDARTMLNDYKKESDKRADEVGKRAGEVKEFLKSSAKSRMDGFKTMMKTIEGRVKDIQSSVTDIKKAAKEMMSHYHKDRMEAAAAWASLFKNVKHKEKDEEGESVKMKKRKIA